MSDAKIPAADQLSLPLERDPNASGRTEQRTHLARSTDSISSHLAIHRYDRSGRRRTEKQELLEWLRRQPEPLTSAEIALNMRKDRVATARRLPDLAHDGAIQRCPLRECRVNGGLALTWRAL